MNVYVAKDERYPEYFIQQDSWYGSGREVEISEEDYRAIKEAEKSFKYWQEFLREKYEAE